MNYKFLPVALICLSGVACLKPAATAPTTPGPVPILAAANPPVTLANFDNIEVGMTIQEVEAFLGRPNSGGFHDEKAPDGTTRKVAESASWVKFAIAIPIGGAEVKQPESCWIAVDLKDDKVTGKRQMGLK